MKYTKMYDDESCNLPDSCDCSQCLWWKENGWDKSRDPR